MFAKLPTQPCTDRLSSQLSEKIDNVRLLAIGIIVISHAENIELEYRGLHTETQPGGPVWVVEESVTHGLTSSAVAIFFVISGYLFFRHFSPTMEAYLHKIRGRLRNVLLPYLLWSGLALLEVAVWQRWSVNDALFHTAPVSSRSLFELLSTWIVHPLPSQLWFLQALLILNLAAPLLFVMLRTAPAVTLLGIAALWCLFPEEGVALEYRAIFCFSFGALLIGSPRLELRTWQKGLLVAVWLVGTVLLFEAYGHSIPVWQPVRVALILVGVSALWFGYDLLPARAVGLLSRYSSFSFFIFLSHEPLQGLLVKAVFLHFPATPLTQMLCYFGIPALVLVLCTGIGVALASSSEALFLVLTGGRPAAVGRRSSVIGRPATSLTTEDKLPTTPACSASPATTSASSPP